MKIAVRFDDICPTMEKYRFKKVVDLLKKYNVVGLLGIVPFNKDTDLICGDEDQDFWDDMIKLQSEGWVIGLHGVEHKLTNYGKSYVSNRMDSEFAGVSYENQLKNITRGILELHRRGLEPEVFFAPAHSFDLNTIKAVGSAGIKIISDGRSHYSYEYRNIKFVPCRVYGLPRKPRGYVTIALHTNQIDEKKFEELSLFLQNNKESLCNYSYLMGLKAHNSIIQKIDEVIYDTYQSYIKPLRIGK